ncbi:MAG: GC-type dockerin domain-anchored protein [Planctomycetota bacterium]
MRPLARLFRVARTLLGLAGLAAVGVGAQPSGEPQPDPGSAFASRAVIERLDDAPFPGRLDASGSTGMLAIGRVGPLSAGAYRARELDPITGGLGGLGDAPVPDPDAALWDDQGLLGPPGAVLVGGVDGIFSVAPDGDVRQQVPAGGWLSNPEDLDFDSQGRLIVADFAERRLYQYFPEFDFAFTLAMFPRGILQFDLAPNDDAYVVDPDGGIAVVCPQVGGIVDLLGESWYTGVAVAPQTDGWAQPGIQPVAGETIYTADVATGNLVRIMPDNSVEVLFTGLFEPQPFDAETVQPASAELAFTPGGRLIVALTDTGAVYAIYDPCSRVDTNGDGTVNGSDFFAWITLFQARDRAADLNFDGKVANDDFTAWVQAFRACVP